MKVRGWEMFLAGILSRPESWADTPPAGPLTFHLTILLSQSRPEKFPSTNKQSESFLFISLERKGKIRSVLYSTLILVSSRVNSILDLRPPLPDTVSGKNI